MNVVSVFTGTGALDLGLERAGMRVVCQCESDASRRRMLARHWPSVPCCEDVRNMRVSARRVLLPDLRGVRVDVLAGGFPCKQLSRARAEQHRLGLAGRDSRLWFEMLRLVRELRPRYVIVENVRDLLDGAIGDILAGLAESGFDAEWDVLPASAFGAPHARERVFIVAYPNESRLQGLHEASGRVDLQPPPRVVRGEWPAEPNVDRVADGPTARLEPARQRNQRLAALGDAVVPQIAEWIGRRILEAERNRAASPSPTESRE